MSEVERAESGLWITNNRT